MPNANIREVRKIQQKERDLFNQLSIEFEENNQISQINDIIKNIISLDEEKDKLIGELEDVIEKISDPTSKTTGFRR